MFSGRREVPYSDFSIVTGLEKAVTGENQNADHNNNQNEVLAQFLAHKTVEFFAHKNALKTQFPATSCLRIGCGFVFTHFHPGDYEFIEHSKHDRPEKEPQ